MSVLSGQTIRALGLVEPCVSRHEIPYCDRKLSYGLGPAGYDLRLDWGKNWSDVDHVLAADEFRLAATVEYFRLPNNVIGMVYDKSSWARRGLSCFNTVLEPGWEGYLTLELKNMSRQSIYLPQGVPIAQVVFTYLDQPTEMPYDGKYQKQAAGPQEAR